VKAEELAVLEGHELSERLKASRRELYELRFQVAVGQLENNREIRKVKKDIARILTVIRGRELAAYHEPAPAAVAAATSPQSGEEIEAPTTEEEAADE